MTKSGGPELGSTPLCTLKNIFFSLLFITPFFMVTWFGGSSTYIVLDADTKPNTVTIEDSFVTEETYDGNKSTRFIIGISVMILVSCFWAVLLLCITLYLGTRVVKFIFVLFILLAVFGGVIMFANESDELFGVTLMLLAVIAVIFFLSVRNKLDFMGANLRVACAAVLVLSSVANVAVAIVVGLFMWSIFWAITVYAFSTNDGETSMLYHGDTYHFTRCTTYFVGYHAMTNFSQTEEVTLPSELKDCEMIQGCTSCYYDDQFLREGACFTPSYNSFHTALLLFCFYYISTVLANVVHSVSAVAAIKWWMCGKATSSDTLSALQQSSFRWLGPICLASLVVSPLRTMYSTVHTIMLLLDIDVTTGRPHRTNPSPHFVTGAEKLHAFLLNLENAVNSFNRYGVSFLVMHSTQYDFTEASQCVTELFTTRGFTSLIHDTVLENILMLACASSGILVMLLATLYTTLVEDSLQGNLNALLPLCCFVTSYLTSLLILQVIQGATSALYVCLAENPDALQTHHPEFFEPFVSAWRKHFPEANVTIPNTSSFGSGTNNSFSVDVFPTAYMPPSETMGKMRTEGSATSSTPQRGRISQNGRRQGSQKYQKLSGDVSDSDSNSDGENEIGQRVVDIGTGSAKLTGVESVTGSNTPSQLSSASATKIFSSPEISQHPGLFDKDDNEFVL